MLVTLRLNTFSRLLYDPRYGQHDNINTPLVKIKMYESIDGFLHPSNVPFETTMTLLFSNVSSVFTTKSCSKYLFSSVSQLQSFSLYCAKTSILQILTRV